MEEALKNLLDGLLSVDLGFLPGVDDALYGEANNSPGNLTRRLVQEDAEVVLYVSFRRDNCSPLTRTNESGQTR